MTSASVSRYTRAVSSPSNHVLLVEDDLGDILLIQRALERGQFSVTLHVAQSGQDALDFLHCRAKHTGAPTPKLVILNLHMRGMSGLEVLNAIKMDAHTASIPVVVLSTSHANDDIQEVYRSGGNCYVCKTIGLSRLLQSIFHYFINIALSPT